MTLDDVLPAMPLPSGWDRRGDLLLNDCRYAVYERGRLHVLVSLDDFGPIHGGRVLRSVSVSRNGRRDEVRSEDLRDVETLLGLPHDPSMWMSLPSCIVHRHELIAAKEVVG